MCRGGTLGNREEGVVGAGKAATPHDTHAHTTACILATASFFADFSEFRNKDT
jgi:hypothetical protein